MSAHRAVDARTGTHGASARDRVSRGDQRGALSGSIRLRLADAADPFGHWRTVYGWFRELARRFLFQTIHDVELILDRE